MFFFLQLPFWSRCVWALLLVLLTLLAVLVLLADPALAAALC
jgi:hypothetical protein